MKLAGMDKLNRAIRKSKHYQEQRHTIAGSPVIVEPLNKTEYYYDS